MHYRSLLCLVVLATTYMALAQTPSQPCLLQHSSLTRWFGTNSEMYACLQAVPFNSGEHPATIAALRNVFAGYSFSDIVRADIAPYHVNVDWETELNRIDSEAYTNDYQPHADLVALFASLGDAHIVYYAPLGYIKARYYLPFSIRSEMIGGVQKFFAAPGPLQESLWDLACSCTSDLGTYHGQEITAIDGVPILDWLATLGAQAGIYVDAGVQMNNILASTEYSFSLGYMPRPSTDTISFTLDGSVVQWDIMFRYDNDITSPSEITDFNHDFSRKRGAARGSQDGYGQDAISAVERDTIEFLEETIANKRASARDATAVRLISIAQASLDKLRATQQASAEYGALLHAESNKRDFNMEAFMSNHYAPLAHVRMRDIAKADRDAMDLMAGFDREAAHAATTAKIRARGASAAGRKASVASKKSTAAATEVELLTGDRTLFTSISNTANTNLVIYNNTIVLKMKSFSTVGDEFLNSVAYAHSLRSSYNPDNLIIDLSDNGGGIICLNYGALNYLIGPWRTNVPYGDDILYSPYDWRISNMSTSLYAYDRSYYFGTNRELDPETGDAFGSSVLTGRQLTHGTHTSSYTQLFNWDLCGRPTSTYIKPPPSSVAPFKKIILLTDGRCGSSCAYFLSHLRYHDKVRVVSYGGVSGSAMATSSFAGGNVYRWDAVVGRAIDAGYSTLRGIQYMDHNALTSFNFRANYDPDSTQIPRQFQRLEADWHISYWDPLIYSLYSETTTASDVMANLYSSIIPLFNDMPADLAGTAPPEEPGAASSLSPLLALYIFAAFLLALFF